MLSMSYAGHHHSSSRSVAAELVSDNDARFASCHLEQLAKESDRGKPIPLRLDKDVEDNAVLIDRPPEVVSDAVDLEKDFIQIPFVASASTSSREPVGI